MKKLLAIIITLSLALTAGCALPPKTTPSPSAAASAAGAYQTIEPKDVKQMMDDGDAFILVDVRTVEEFSAAHIEGALNIPVETIGGVKPALLPDLNEMIVLYCRTGNRTVTASKALVALGYTKIYDMGGIVDWPYETVNAESASPAETAPAVSANAPSSASGILSAFYATDIDGNFVDASVFEEYKLTMVNIWATFCGPCIQEMPELGKLNGAYRDKGFQIVGIVIDASDSTGAPIPEMVSLAKKLVSETGADYEHLLPSSDLNKLILGDISAVPTTIFVDAKGNQVGEQYVGSRSGEAWASIIDSLLETVG
jgi:rhodanese-related sulfurtransferase/thiol-disulfide isomerase/thioredoxin